MTVVQRVVCDRCTDDAPLGSGRMPGDWVKLEATYRNTPNRWIDICGSCVRELMETAELDLSQTNAFPKAQS